MWGFISLIGFFCAVVFLGFSLVSIFSVFTKKGKLVHGVVAILLSGVFFGVFILGAMKNEQTFLLKQNKISGKPVEPGTIEKSGQQ
jgi:hypothetical protein